MFGRRRKESMLELASQWVWPRIGWRRWAHYMSRRVVRIKDSPHKIAIGFACGALASCTPYIGLHFILAFLLAWMLGGSLIASALGTAVGNPLTFPFIWLSSLNLGNFILGRRTVNELPVDLSFSMLIEKPMQIIGPILLPMTIGGLILGLVAAAIVYWPVREIVAAYQRRRRAKLEARREALNSTEAHAGE